MFCPYCGHNVGEVVKFCGSCGKHIEFLAFVDNSKYFTNYILKKRLSQPVHKAAIWLFTVYLHLNAVLMYYIIFMLYKLHTRYFAII